MSTVMSFDHRPQPVTPKDGDEVIDRLAAASRRQGLDGLAGQLHALSAWLGDDLASVEAAVAAFEVAPKDLAERAARHILARPGKRIRALCVLFSARLGDRSPPSPDTRDLAAAAELVHAATLLHDDVIDEGAERRGAPSARVVYGNSASILGGDHLLIGALRRVQGAGRPDLLVEILDVIGEMIAAEAVQLELRGMPPPADLPSIAERREVYHRVVLGKTAALFRWSMRAGGVLAGLSPEQVTALGEAGEAVGVSFQLVDDTIDLCGDPTVAGKDVLADLKEGKLTWPILAALEQDPSLSRRLASALEDGDIAGLAERVRALGGIEAAQAEAKRWGDRAQSKLASLPDSVTRRGFEALVRAALDRRS